jgi:uncharacterized repeat protein (TIGR01451 family)
VIGKAASQEVAASGDVLTYTLSVTVTGSVVNGAVVRDVLPGHLDFVGFGPSPAGTVMTHTLATRELAWELPPLPPGVHELTYQATVDTSVTEGTVLVNCARLTFSWSSAVRESCEEVEIARAYTVRVGVYNSAGELVKEIWVRRLGEQVRDFNIAENPVISKLDDVVYVMHNGVEIATWDGTNVRGEPVINGKYHLKIDNVDAYGVVHSVSKEVTVSRSIALVEVKVFNSAGEVVRNLYLERRDAVRDADGRRDEHGVGTPGSGAGRDVGREERRGDGGVERAL